MAPDFRAGPPLVGESALVDRETGRIYWQEGGSTSSVISVNVKPMLGRRNLKHVRATILSSVLLLAAFSKLVSWIGDNFLRWCPAELACDDLPFHGYVLRLLARCTVLRLPNFDGRFLLAIGLLYLLESYGCSTRRYLANALSTPSDVEDYVEGLRRADPVVTWKVRCFHYEKRKWLTTLLLLDVWDWMRAFGRGGGGPTLEGGSDEGLEEEVSDSATLAASLLTRKVVTYESSRRYNFSSCEDNTTTGIWKRAETVSTLTAPFTKLSLSKMIVFANVKARKDYFDQQGEFVTTEGRRDAHAEFSTSIHVEGFKPKVLAVRPVEGVLSAKLFRSHLFWTFTLLGLTVPFRIWFARHCDELRVTVVKETSSDVIMAPSSSSPWLLSRPWSRGIANKLNARSEMFRKQMQHFSLYKSDKEICRQADKDSGNVTFVDNDRKGNEAVGVSSELGDSEVDYRLTE